MTIIICISDLWNKRQYFHIENNNVEKLSTNPWRSRPSNDFEASDKSNADNQLQPLTSRKTLRRARIDMDGISAFYFLRELLEFTNFRLQFIKNPALREIDLLWIQLVPPKREIIDYKWNDMIRQTLWEKIEVDYLMSWLSTLGGGFSALGEQFTHCAKIAGKISLRQLAIGMRLGDPYMQARCKLYYSISLIQIGNLRQAKHIIRDQYKFALKVKEIDGRLVKMCEGIWLRLQYEYGLRIKENERKKLLLAEPEGK